ncbi:MAG TPA: 2-oxoglutarate dehydrogenase complex dihydrolipoyllysine-residue succinyltransferase [Trueperaceae bacterium]|nr:2-oxoglutarate dehydrogenase complex dihydrolipoyllysine-residue succinyltransferase [Trueperaceae bacterium]
MATDVKVPAAGESISEVIIGTWLKSVGDPVAADEPLVEVETDKATLEVPAPVAGVLTEQFAAEGDTVGVGDVIARVDESQAGVAASSAPAAAAEKAEEASAAKAPEAATRATPAAGAGPRTAGGTTAAPAASASDAATAVAEPPPEPQRATSVMPAAQRLLDEHGLSAYDVQASGPGGRLLKEDVQRFIEERERQAAQSAGGDSATPVGEPAAGGARQEERVRMSPLRRTVATRLVEAQQTAALLTTFNEIDMTAVMDLRKEYRDTFEKRYGIRLGFMSFFVKAVIDALKLIPQLNAEIKGDDIVYKNYYDIGVAVSAKKGLVVPVIRDADRMSFAELENAIADYGQRAQANRLTPDELQGGTFTISNGGVFGSLMSTPIVNPPQSGVLGMHAIQERPVARDGQVVILPMMYVALTYDHRIVDGREAVTFLKRIKEAVEAPARMLLEV